MDWKELTMHVRTVESDNGKCCGDYWISIGGLVAESRRSLRNGTGCFTCLILRLTGLIPTRAGPLYCGHTGRRRASFMWKLWWYCLWGDSHSSSSHMLLMDAIGLNCMWEPVRSSGRLQFVCFWIGRQEFLQQDASRLFPSSSFVVSCRWLRISLCESHDYRIGNRDVIVTSHSERTFP
jgi:hypothetical protein